ncbi:sulfatase [Thalassotalea sp. PLHSN55]|uniref:sulfatase n=1 Tax=Thalassotalea sp. PLHSN55 TaxID=3435888 RepID=UPI003F878475
MITKQLFDSVNALQAKCKAVLLAVIASLAFVSGITSAQAEQAQPNILVIVSDDGGYSDFGFAGDKNFPTPNLTKLANSGVVFDQGYVSASVCSPSRAGLLTGRYQQRFGHHHNLPNNPVGNDKEENLGMSTSESTIADYLKAEGYYTGAIGKWHLGRLDKYHPTNRGFDEFYGLLGGSRNYFPKKAKQKDHLILRNGDVVGFEDYLTDALGFEAEDFIERNQEQPFFLYLSYTAVHGPMNAKKSTMAKYPEIESKNRRKMAAMMEDFDISVGRVIDKLDTLGLRENTLVVFINDNGGSKHNFSVNLPLKGFKGAQDEGSLRVPYLMSWPGKIPQGLNFTSMVSALDIAPTALAAAGGKMPTKKKFDGVNLLPFLNEKTAKGEGKQPHNELFWNRAQFATVRDGDFKLIRERNGGTYLYNIANDVQERNNLVNKQPEKAQTLAAKLDAWLSELPEPAWDTAYTLKMKQK